MSGRTQWKTKSQALKLIAGKPCRICGQPSCCAVRDWGIQPVCITHGRQAQKMGYVVDFPDRNGDEK